MDTNGGPECKGLWLETCIMHSVQVSIVLVHAVFNLSSNLKYSKPIHHYFILLVVVIRQPSVLKGLQFTE